MIEQNKYLFEEYDDYNDCEQCGRRIRAAGRLVWLVRNRAIVRRYRGAESGCNRSSWQC